MTNFFPYASHSWQPEPIPQPIILPPSSGPELNDQRNLVTRDITRKCWNCRHDRKGCKYSTDMSACEWCIKNKYQCTEDAPPIARKRKTARFRCQQCRTRKQKCLPEDRQWPEKCDECKRHNLDCSEPQLPKRARSKEQNISAAALLHENDCASMRTVPESSVIEDPVPSILPASDQGLTVEMPLEASELRKEILECSRRLGKSYGLFKALWVTLEDDLQEYRCNCDHDWLLVGYTSELDKAEKFSSDPVANDFPLELRLLYSNMVQGYEVVLQCNAGYRFSNEEDDDDRDEFHRRMLHKRIISSMTRLASMYTSTDEYEAAIQVYEKVAVHISRSSGDFRSSEFLTSLLGDTVKDLVALYKRQHETLQEHLERHEVDSSTTAIPLHRAIATGVPELVSAILDGAGVDINAEDFYRRTGLHHAAKRGFPDVLEILLKRGADPNRIDDEWRTAVEFACSSGSLKCVEILCDAGANIERYADSCAVVAAKLGHFEIVMMLKWELDYDIDYINCALQGAVEGEHYALARTLLLDDSANPNAPSVPVPDPSCNPGTRTPLHNASDRGHEAIVRLLLERKAKTDTVCSSGTALHISCERGHIGIARMLLQYGADVNSNLKSASQTSRDNLLNHGALVNPTGQYDYTPRGSEPWCNSETPLQMACREGHEDIVRLLLEHKADVNASGPFAPSLYIACERNLEAVAKLLVEAGANVDSNHNYETSLQKACQKGHEGIVRLLLEHKADVNATGPLGPALHMASSKGHESIVRSLLLSNADVNAANCWSGETALHIASSEGHESIVSLLLQFGANANACDRRSDTPLHKACRNDSEEVVRLLFLGRADTNIVGSHGTPLHLASARGYKRTVELLLKAGAEVNDESGLNGTALASALKEGHHDVVNLLLKHGATDVRAVTV